MSRNRWPAEHVVAALQREGVTTMFGINGGHINPIMDHAYRAGIDVYQVRHEQAAVHAADGYARLTREPGVAFATAGPGMTNTITAMHMAYVAHTPVVLLLGGHKLVEEGRGTAQEADARSVLASVTKSVRRATLPEQADLYVRMAFREAMTYPFGPVAVEFPLDMFNDHPIAADDQLGHLPDGGYVGRPPGSYGDPRAVAQAFELLTNAERPLILAGDGVHWDAAGEELCALAETISAPVSLRRHARGAVPENHRLVIPAQLRKEAIEQADVVLVLGMELNYLESFGNWISQAKFIQASRHPSEVSVALPTAVEIIADHKSLLTQLLQHAATVQAPETRSASEWAQSWTQKAEDYRRTRDQNAGLFTDGERLHPAVVASELSAALPADVPIVLDSFTASGYLAQHLEPQSSGFVLDAGLSAAFGHGVGMAIGASIARGNRPVVSVLGDGGVGLGGGDIETAVRYGVPAVFVVYNNSALCGGLETFAYGKDYSVLGPKARGGFNVTEDVAYEQMYAPLGVHTELVTKPGELAAALHRALESGRTSVINVLADRDVQPGLYQTAHAGVMFWHLPADEVESPARARHHEQLYPRYHDGRTLKQDLEGTQ